LDDDAESELVRGCDDLVGKLGHAFNVNIDIFEHYVLRNVLRVPEGLGDESGSEAEADSASPVTGPTCTEAELAAIQRRSEELQQKLVAVRAAVISSTPGSLASGPFSRARTLIATAR
jgi:hypothetical protein